MSFLCWMICWHVFWVAWSLTHSSVHWCMHSILVSWMFCWLVEISFTCVQNTVANQRFKSGVISSLANFGQFWKRMSIKEPSKSHCWLSFAPPSDCIRGTHVCTKPPFLPFVRTPRTAHNPLLLLGKDLQQTSILPILRSSGVSWKIVMSRRHACGCSACKLFSNQSHMVTSGQQTGQPSSANSCRATHCLQRWFINKKLFLINSFKQMIVVKHRLRGHFIWYNVMYISEYECARLKYALFYHIYNGSNLISNLSFSIKMLVNYVQSVPSVFFQRGIREHHWRWQMMAHLFFDKGSLKVVSIWRLIVPASFLFKGYWDIDYLSIFGAPFSCIICFAKKLSTRERWMQYRSTKKEVHPSTIGAERVQHECEGVWFIPFMILLWLFAVLQKHGENFPLFVDRHWCRLAENIGNDN